MRSASRPRHLLLCCTLPAALAAGCESYTPAPLDLPALLARVEQERGAAVPLTLREAALRQREVHPRLRALRAAHDTAAALREAGTPLANPTVSVEPRQLTGPGILGSLDWGVEAALGWVLPFPGVRASHDDYLAVRAEAALVQRIAAEREEYLSLRAAVSAAHFARARRGLRAALAATADGAWTVARRLAAAGQLGAAELVLLEGVTWRAQAELAQAEEAEAEARAGLGRLLGLSAAALAVRPLPVAPLPDAVPEPGVLREVLLRDHPGLHRLRAEYAVCEQRLRHQVALQYPGLQVGGTYERQDEVDRFGLVLGIPIPLFDRNQSGIAEARGQRAEAAVAFEGALAAQLAAIEDARARLHARGERWMRLRAALPEAARRASEAAESALRGGLVDALRYLDLQSAEQTLRLLLLDAEEAVHRSWHELEAACGAPLLRFPDEPEADR
ncbi:MAG: TolC family protein [Planctomycetes bacterium]|nr:TolC family protein [Planctomycetota bacterium]